MSYLYAAAGMASIICLQAGHTQFSLANNTNRELHVILCGMQRYLLLPNTHQAFSSESNHILVGWPVVGDKLTLFALTVENKATYQLWIGSHESKEFLHAVQIKSESL